MSTLILTTANGGFNAQLDNNGNILDYGLIDCNREPSVKLSTQCPTSGDDRYIIVDREENPITNPVRIADITLDGNPINPNDILTFLDVLCPVVGGGGATDLTNLEGYTDEIEPKLDDVIYSLEKNGLSTHEVVTTATTYSPNLYKEISFSVLVGDADISLNGDVVNYNKSDSVIGFQLENQSSTGVPDTVTVTPSANSEVVVIYKSL